MVMTAPNMETITASLERSLQNCSLNSHPPQSHTAESQPHPHPHPDVEAEAEDQGSALDVADGVAIGSSSTNSDATLDLNSHISLPYHWEQCLDLKTGEIYYINWRNGMKAKEDPRRMGGEYYSEDESWYDSEESSSESCPSSSKEHSYNSNNQVEKQNNVLVVAGCKSCLMYFMVPKQVEDCPKCSGQLLHFDRSENASSSP